MSLNKNTILYHRLKHHYFYDELNDKIYPELFKLLQPVQPVSNSCPGSPPSLTPRGNFFDDQSLNYKLRADRKIIKGRFAKGKIGYVSMKDIDLYANAFNQPLKKMNYVQNYVYNAIKSAGPLTPRQIKEETGFLNKEIMPALHRLQKAFLVYEDQIDNDWERSWYIFEREIPNIDLDERKRLPALEKIILRLLKVNIFLTQNNIIDILQLNKKIILQVLDSLMQNKLINEFSITDLGKGFVLPGYSSLEHKGPLRNVFVLHNADPFVFFQNNKLKENCRGKEVLKFLMIDGEINGALIGHWRIKPHDISNIEISLPYIECKARYNEIENAVYKVYSRTDTKILNFMGDVK